MSAVTFLTSEQDWSRALSEAKSLETLRAVVAGWMPYVPDALRIVERMGAQDFEAFRDGLALERKKLYAGDEWADKFGELAIPTALMKATLLAERFGVPLGAMLLKTTKVRA